MLNKSPGGRGGEGKKKKKNPKQGTGLMGAMQISLRGIKKNNNPHWPLFSTGQRFVRDL